MANYLYVHKTLPNVARTTDEAGNVVGTMGVQPLVYVESDWNNLGLKTQAEMGAEQNEVFESFRPAPQQSVAYSFYTQLLSSGFSDVDARRMSKYVG